MRKMRALGGGAEMDEEEGFSQPGSWGTHTISLSASDWMPALDSSTRAPASHVKKRSNGRRNVNIGLLAFNVEKRPVAVSGMETEMERYKT